MSTAVSLDGDAKPAKKARRGHAKPIDKELLRIDPGAMIKKLIVFFGLLAIGGALALSPYVAGWIAGTFVLGAMFAHGVELTHQFLHSTGFRNRALNRVFGVLCALPQLVSHSHYRALHLAHHRDLGTPQNKEFFNYGNVKGRPFLIVLLRSFSLGRFLSLAKNIGGALIGRAPNGANNAEDRRAINGEYLLMLAVIAGAAAFTAVTRDPILVRLWVIPLLVVAEPIHFWVELPEHFGCDLTTKNVLHNTRTIRGSWFTFWFTNGNNFHVEHHLYPKIAIDKLPRVHATLRNDILHFNPTYWSFLGTVLSPESEVVAEVASDAPYMEVTESPEVIDVSAQRAQAAAAVPEAVVIARPATRNSQSSIAQERA